MNYFVKRGEQEYGPYSLAALQQYVQQGNISPEDMARSEGMTDWMKVSSILGNVPVTPNQFGAAVARVVPSYPLPPKLHWAVVTLLSIVTIGIFYIIWAFIQAVWIRKVRPKSKALWFLIAYVVLGFGPALFDNPGIEALCRLAGSVCFLIAAFQMRSDIEEFYATLNPAGISLSGVMTFFFNIIYFQYHLGDIREYMEGLYTESARAQSAGS